MLELFNNHINTNFPFLKDKNLLIAISGGVDSVVLTHFLSKLGFKISLAHCNFNLRGNESNLDEKFVKELGERLSVPVFTMQFDTKKHARKNKLSIQIAARNLRYSWFKELLEKHNFHYLLTAHHTDDSLETSLINFIRGSSLEGLMGIPEINGKIVRPLLAFSKEEIFTYSKENNINWRDDKSNLSSSYIRNRIRHEVVPVLKEINGSLLKSYRKTTKSLQESRQIVEDKVLDISNKILITEKINGTEFIKIDIIKLRRLPNLKAYLYQLLKKYNFKQWDDIYNLLTAQSGKQVFSKTYVLLKDRNFLVLSKRLVASAIEKTYEIFENQRKIYSPVCLNFENAPLYSKQNNKNIFIDRDKLTFPLKLRGWQKGDLFYPYGMKGKKKLSKFFKDEKMALFQKSNTWLLCNNDDAIVWVVGIRPDSRFVSNEKTINKIKISL